MAKGKYQKWLQPENLLLIEGWARDGLNDEQIADKMDIAVSTLYEWKNKYSEFSESLKKSKEIVDKQVENALFKRAVGCTVTEVVEQRLDDKGQNKRHNGISELTEWEWEFAIKYFGGKCCYCGKTTENPTKDHIIPLNKGGQLTRENVLPCCGSCNSSKKDRDMLKWFKGKQFYSKARYEKIELYLQLVKSLSDWFDKGNGELSVVKRVIKELPPDVTACIYWLKNRQPNKWRDKTADEFDTTPPNISINITPATPEIE